MEGISNKARVTTKRCYGVKSSGTLWNRFILDLNRAPEAVGWSIAELREIVTSLKAAPSRVPRLKPEEPTFFPAAPVATTRMDDRRDGVARERP